MAEFDPGKSAEELAKEYDITIGINKGGIHRGRPPAVSPEAKSAESEGNLQPPRRAGGDELNLIG